MEVGEAEVRGITLLSQALKLMERMLEARVWHIVESKIEETIKQVNSFVYLGGTVCEDGGSSKEIQRRVQAGAAAWRRVEGIMWDRKLKKQLKEKCWKPAWYQPAYKGWEHWH